jgi:hypothetical protein
MIKGLRVALIVWAVVAIVMGVVYIFFPNQLLDMGDYGKGSGLELYLLALLGICYITGGAFAIFAAVRDLLKNIRWVQFAIVVAILTVVVTAASMGRGLVTFEAEGISLIVNAVLAAALLALYPWRAKSS